MNKAEKKWNFFWKIWHIEFRERNLFSFKALSRERKKSLKEKRDLLALYYSITVYYNITVKSITYLNLIEF